MRDYLALIIYIRTIALYSKSGFLFRYLPEKADMNNELGILSNDLRIYFKGFETALEKKDVMDAIRYLNQMRKEVDENLEFLMHFYTIGPEEKRRLPTSYHSA